VTVALADLDDTLLAARWARAVISTDAPLIAACEREATYRGTTPRALIAATKKKEPKGKDVAANHPGANAGKSYQQIANQAKAARDAGDPLGAKRGKTKPENVGKGRFRKKSGEGGGQFTSADDPEAIAEGDIVKGHTDQQTLSQKRKAVRERRSAEDENDRRSRFEEDAKDRSADDDDRAAGEARKAARDARKVMEATEDQDIGTRIRANEDFQKKSQGQITLMQRQLAEARQTGHEDDENKLLDSIKAAQTELENARADRVALEQTKQTKQADRTNARVNDSAEETRARQVAAEQKRVRDEAKRVARENTRRTTKEARDAEDAQLEAEAQELRDRIEEARQRKRDAQAAKKAEKEAKKKAKTGSVVAAGIDFTPDLHPRGKDGKFIEKFGLVDVFGLSGFQHGQRGNKNVQGEVAEIIPDPKQPKNPVIRVKVTDPRWKPDKFGPTVDVRANQIQARATPKAHITPTKPEAPSTGGVPGLKPDVVPSTPAVTVIPARTVLPGMSPDPEGPHFQPMTPPGEWAGLTKPEQLAWINDRMTADFTKWRGQPTGFDLTGFDPGVALNLANTYRDLANWDPQTAQRIDNPILSTGGTGGGLPSNAIAVAHPGTAHPGGIGEKTGPASMVLGEKFFSGMKFWHGQNAADAAKSKGSWSMSSKYGDPTLTLTHEFAHQRQFRMLDLAMADANKAWSPVTRDDGFGLVPDSSNWTETQALRYEIQKLAPTNYGKSKSSEAFAESWTAKMTGDSSPELDTALEQWDVYMGLVENLPVDRHWETKSFDELTDAEKDQFWTDNGKYLDLPGMSEHYPDSAAAYTAWQAGKEPPEPTTPFGYGYSSPAADWTEDGPAAMLTDPGELDDLYTSLDANRRQVRRLRLTYPTGIGDPQNQTVRVRPPDVQAEMDRLDTEFADLRGRYHPPLDYTGPSYTPASPGAVIEGPNGTQWEATAEGDSIVLTHNHPSGTTIYVESTPNGIRWSIHEEGHDEPLKAGNASSEVAAMDDALWYADQIEVPEGVLL